MGGFYWTITTVSKEKKGVGGKTQTRIIVLNPIGKREKKPVRKNAVR